VCRQNCLQSQIQLISQSPDDLCLMGVVLFLQWCVGGVDGL